MGPRTRTSHAHSCSVMPRCLWPCFVPSSSLPWGSARRAGGGASPLLLQRRRLCSVASLHGIWPRRQWRTASSSPRRCLRSATGPSGASPSSSPLPPCGPGSSDVALSRAGIIGGVASCVTHNGSMGPSSSDLAQPPPPPPPHSRTCPLT